MTRLPKVVYGTPWIEVDFGQRPQGWMVYVDRETCISRTRQHSKEGPYDSGGYLGPERPLKIYEIPTSFLELPQKSIRWLRERGSVRTPDYWSPRFVSRGESI